MPAPRVDRLLTLFFFLPLGRAGRGRRESRLPILMYHSVSEDVEAGVSPYYRVCTHPDVFAQHMALLHSDGYEAVGLKNGLDRFQRRTNPDEKLAVITFDDGFRDFYSTAFPILQRHGFGATMFLPTDFIGRETRRFKGRECMTWNEVRELRQAGIEFGSHTVNHPKLYDLEFAQIQVELEKSKAVIEHELGEAIGSFAYPYAFPSADSEFTDGLIGLLKGARYDQGVTTEVGRVARCDAPFTLKRLPVNSADDPRLFRAKLDGAYDWLGWPQGMVKQCKRIFTSRKNRARGGAGRQIPN